MAPYSFISSIFIRELKLYLFARIGPANKAKVPIEASFSPDSQLIFTGGADGRVHVWNAIDGKKVCALDTHHRAPVQCVQFNPQHMMLASGGENLAFWLPNPENLLPQ